jgi:hypothetical protein
VTGKDQAVAHPFQPWKPDHDGPPRSAVQGVLVDSDRPPRELTRQSLEALRTEHA